MKKASILIPALLCLTLCACTSNNSPADPSSTTSTVTTAPAPVDKGTLSIEHVYAWVGYPDADFYPKFSMERFAVYAEVNILLGEMLAGGWFE